MTNDQLHKKADARRRALRFVVFASLSVVAVAPATFAYCWFRTPVLANPIYSLDAIDQQQVCPGTVSLLAGMAPLLFCATFFLVATLGGVLAVTSVQERRYLDQLVDLHDRLSASDVGERRGDGGLSPAPPR